MPKKRRRDLGKKENALLKEEDSAENTEGDAKEKGSGEECAQKPKNKISGTVSAIRGFFSSRFNCGLFLLLVILGFIAWFGVDDGPPVYDPEEHAVHLFYTPSCPYCAQQKPILYGVMENYPEIALYEHDASTMQGSAFFRQLAEEAGLDPGRLGVPTIFIKETVLVGFHSKEQISSAIEECLAKCKGEAQHSERAQGLSYDVRNFNIPFIGERDLTAYSLPVLTVVLGLVDGFNPCALWVLIFLISLIIGLNDRKKIWLIVGTFVFASGAIYFLLMAAWLNLFLIIGYIRIVSIFIGLIALAGGILSLKEYFTTKGDLTCKVGDEKSHQKTMDRVQNIVARPLSIPVFFSIVALAFIVNSVEFVCSAALPVVYTQVLALSGLSGMHYYLYIAAYVFFFMLDQIIIFGMAALAIGSPHIQKYAKACKLIGGVVMFIVGIVMLFFPHLLR
jgi:thiol-disulfide isomerase/thioredoxin